jgi:hypothetical protein
MTDHMPTCTPHSVETDRIGAPQLARALIADGWADRPVPYGAIYRGILSGAIPAEQVSSNRWTVSRADLPKVAAALGLRAQQQVAA